jgi:cytoskeletal protein CcmA (bactofilin family)
MSMRLIRCIFLTVLFLLSLPLSAQQAGEHVSISGDIDDDLYLAGGQIDMYASVDGDVVVAGGQLNLEGNVRADVIAAGGDIELRGTVADDVRVAGGNVRVLAKIGDDLVAASGRLQIGPMTEIGGSAWISAGDVFVDGKISEMLRVNGGRVTVSGTVAGNVEISANRIEISSTAIIIGNLHYRSPHPAKIAEGARIEGEVTHTPVDVPIAPFVAGLLVVCLVFLLSIVITGIALYLVFPGVAESCSKIIRDKPWASLGYGLAVFAGVPVIFVLLFSTGFGFLLALLLLAAYLIMLLTGYIAGAYFVTDVGLRKLNKDKVGKTARIVSLALAIALLSIVNIIPVLGSLVNWLVLLAGVGALGQRVTAAHMKQVS